MLAWLVGARAVLAAPARVALVHEVEPNALEQRTLTRLRAELVAAGFETTEMERRGGDAREAAEADPVSPGVFATIAIVPRTADAADIWVADRITGKTVVRRIQVSGGAGHDVATVLAVRAVELLQASLLEVLDPAPHAESMTAPPMAPAPRPVVPSDVSAWMSARGPGTDARFALQAGAGVIHSFSGVGPAVLPVLGLGYRLTNDLSLGLRAGGPAFAADLQAPGGTIAVRQQLLVLDVTYELLSPNAMVRPVAVGGIGAYHLDVVGAASPPYKGESDDLFAALVAIGPGARLRLGERASLLGDVRLLFIAPQPRVRAAGAEVGSMSRPSLFGEVVVDVAF
ncbi:MAG TPA: hypothetical protein VK540_02525 [Polyangiaceae bacterium]|nr:hypothetical protein [Polyangiaceae bacterium]